MNIHEYQAKELLKSYGVRIQEGIVADSPESALEAAKLRLRPILMTSFAFMLGVVPLLTASGAGAEARKVMGMAVFSGTLIATIIGVIVVPGLFVLIESIGGKRKKPEAPVSPSEPTH